MKCLNFQVNSQEWWHKVPSAAISLNTHRAIKLKDKQVSSKCCLQKRFNLLTIITIQHRINSQVFCFCRILHRNRISVWHRFIMPNKTATTQFYKIIKASNLSDNYCWKRKIKWLNRFLIILSQKNHFSQVTFKS